MWNAELPIGSLWDAEVVLVPALDAFVLRNRGTHREIRPADAVWLFETAARRDMYAVRSFASRAGGFEYRLHLTSDEELRAWFVMQIERGELVGVQQVEAADRGAEADVVALKRRLAADIESHAHGDIIVRGEHYRLVADLDLDHLADRWSYEVVRRADAERVLDAIAQAAGTSGRLQDLLGQAREQLAQDWRQPFRPDGIVLLRRRPIARVARVVEGPTYTPSELKALADKERPRLHSFEIIAYDSFGQVLPGVRLTLNVDGGERTVTTDGGGRARYEGASDETATAGVADPDQIRNLLMPRWTSPPKQTNAAAMASAIPIVLGDRAPALPLVADVPTKIVFRRNVLRVRLIGMFFDHAKCFLLPGALDGVRRLVELYAQHPNANLLIVGHTDTRHAKTSDGEGDSFNRRLSLERAKAVAAYLTDDVDTWSRWYGVDGERRWGTTEDLYMLGYAAGQAGTSADGGDDSRAATRSFQQQQGLPTTGNIGDLTRRALIQQYMAADGTTLPDGISVTTHGCGPYFPDVEAGRNDDVPQNRRVEMFVFDGPIAPPPAGDYSEPGSPEYPAWVAQVQETIDFATEEPSEDSLEIILHDTMPKQMKDVPYRVTIRGVVQEEGTSATGNILVRLPQSCGERVFVEWGPPTTNGAFSFQRQLHIDCSEGSPELDLIRARLHNIGYDVDSEEAFELAVRAFQRDYQICESGLDDGSLPPATRAKLWSIYETNCDASCSPRVGAG